MCLENAKKYDKLYKLNAFLEAIVLKRFLIYYKPHKLIFCLDMLASLFVSLIGIVILALPVGSASLAGLLLIGVGFGPIFPSVLHTVPARFGKTYSADITGYHMGGAYAIGFGVQLIYGFVASATTFKITAFVLLALCIGVFLANEKTISSVRKG